MNGNTPYAGSPGTTEAGRRAPGDRPDLSREQQRTLRADIARIAAETRTLLPEGYVVGAELSGGEDGALATVAVRPPVGNPVSAGLTPELDGDGLAAIDDDERREVARGLAASAALQVKSAMAQTDHTPAAR